MAQQLKFTKTGKIISTSLHTEMRHSYLEYAMSVIVGRALPDARDGLKPVHRRILYAMYELGLPPERPFRKCARVVGDVLGKYHPHGDQAVYDALVRMAQDFSSRYPLLSGHGNFGSIDNDPPAAMRYTETRLSSIANEGILGEIGENIIDFNNNFDNSQQEPIVLPVKIPNLLVNGCTGIAVGMATNIPPHNLGELIDGLIALLEKPELSNEKLWKIIPGPDFPTGGEIIQTEGIKDAYRDGKGIIRVRGVVSIEKINVGKKRRQERTALIITELPYQVNKAAWIEKIADLVNCGRLEGIADIRDESDRTGMRVVIELKRDAVTKLVLKELYKKTALEHNFGAIMLALVDNQPQQLSLRSLLEEFLSFREKTLNRQYSNELKNCQDQSDILKGLLIALANLDKVINILCNSVDSTIAKEQFQKELGLNEKQANGILAMPMRRLTGLERKKIETEYEELQIKVNKLEILLKNRKEFLAELKKELRSLKKKYGDKRRTRIIGKDTTKINNIETQKLDVPKQPILQSKKKISHTPKQLNLNLSKDSILEMTYQGEVAWRKPEDRGFENKLLIYSEIIGEREQIIVITDNGKAYPIKILDIPYIDVQSTFLISLLPENAQKDTKSVISIFFLTKNVENRNLLLLTNQGKIKRIQLSELNSLTNRGLSLMKLKNDDFLKYISFVKEEDEIVIAITSGRLLRFQMKNEEIPVMNRNTQGEQAFRLRSKEEIVGCINMNKKDDILLVSKLGYGKRLNVLDLRITKLGDIGTQALKFIHQADSLLGIKVSSDIRNINILTNKNRVITTEITEVENNKPIVELFDTEIIIHIN